MAWALNKLPDLTDQEFSKWLLLLEERTGISFEKHRRILQTGLGQRMRELNIESYREYYQQICYEKGGASEWAALLKTLTVKETRFFRDPDAAVFLKKYLLRLLHSKQYRGPLSIWSVASSTGEEPYTLAMLSNDCIQGLSLDTLYGVTATDICLSSLAIAKKGIYSKRRLGTLAPEYIKRYFDTADGEQFSVNQQLRERVCFAHANLIDLADLPVRDVHVIFCQNVLIYFKRWRQQQVLDELVERLQPNGLLIVGMGEASGWKNKQVVRVKDDKVQAYIKIAQ